MRATDAQVLDDAERLIATCNQGQAKRMPKRFSPTIGAAIAARYQFLWICCPACKTINAITCAPSTGTAAPRLRASFPCCRADMPAECAVC
jgi:hypothetical protein